MTKPLLSRTVAIWCVVDLDDGATGQREAAVLSFLWWITSLEQLAIAFTMELLSSA